MSWFTEKLETMEDVRKKDMSAAAVYRRGDTELPVNATIGETSFRALDENGFSVLLHSRDFIFSAAETASLGRPRRGDEVVFNGFVHEVSEFNNEPCWKWSDAAQTAYRVHTKQIEEET